MLTPKTKILTIILVIFTLQGCGLQFWYNRLAWLSTWYADDYVELTSTQEDRIEALVSKHAMWHRATQLPQYNQFLNDVIDDLKNHRVEQHYDSYGQRLRVFYNTILDKVLDDAVHELAQLSDAQINDMMANINASAQEKAQEYLSQTNQEKIKRARESAIELYEEWLDELTDSQERLIVEHVEQLQPTRKLTIKYRKQWREAFALALKERQSASGQKALYSLLKKPRQLRSVALIANTKNNNLLRKNLQIQLFNSASDKQIKHFIDYLNDYRDDFSELIRDD